MDIVKLIIKHEGLKLRPYVDTVGKVTIGVGRNLDDRGVTEEEALTMLDNDIDFFNRLLSKFEWFCNIDDIRRDAIIDMTFNLGFSGFKKFKKMISALEIKDYKTASIEMLDSKWAAQVGNRAKELSKMIESGEWQDDPNN